MAVTKAEDDEEGFGDFTFASFPNQTTVHSDQINGRISATTDDDEWGDFVEFPPPSDLSSGISHTQSPPVSSEPSKPFDPCGFFQDHSSKPSQSMPTVSSPVESERTQWVKPKGALPLSLFGDEEDEEEKSDLVDPPVVDAKDSSADKHVGNAKNGSNIYLDGGINDIIANMYNRSQQIKTQNESNWNLNGTNSNPAGVNADMNGLVLNPSELNSSSDFDGITTLYNLSQQSKAVNGLSSNSNGLNSNLNASISNLSGLNSNSYGLNSDLFASFSNLSVLNSNSDGLNSNITASTSNLSGLNSKLNGWNLDLKASTSNNIVFNSNLVGLTLNSDFAGGNKEFDGDDDGWEFKDAFSESKVEYGNSKVDGEEQETSEVTAYSSGFNNGSPGSIHLPAASNGFSSKSSLVDMGFNFKPLTVAQYGFSSDSYSKSEQNNNEDGFDFKPLTVAQNGFSSDSYSKAEQNNNENGLNSDPIVGSADSCESFGEFKYAFSEIGLKQEEPKVNDLSHSEVGLLGFDGKTQGNEFRSENHKGALPLSIFGDEELEIDYSLNSPDIFMHKPAPYAKSGVNIHSSKVSINDILSDLYSQAAHSPSVDSTQKLTENAFNSIETVSDSNLVNGDDDFEDSSWEFKDASFQTSAKDQTSLLSPADAHQNYSNKLKVDNYVDFYCRLKDELCFVARCHLDSLKEARNAAFLSREDVNVAALDVEIQEALKELCRENVISNDVYSEDHPLRYICLDKFLEVLNEPKFQVLESEYDLSRRLQLAEKYLRSAIELMKHCTSILNVLLLGSIEEQSSYISTWSKITSVCAEELKHGAWIWKQSSEKNLQHQILSEPRGKQFILALGEVYRIVAVIEASTKLYKPWILSSSVDSIGIYTLLEECHTVWSHSGLEEALRSMSDSIDVEYDTKVMALLESIKYIHDLDERTLGDHLFSRQELICQLSALPLGAVPDMKTTVWNGEHFFLTLANLWANLISCDSPNLPRIHYGQ